MRSLFTRNLNIIWFSNFAFLAAYTIQAVLLPLYMQEAGFPESTNGFVTGFVAIGLLVALVLLGPTIDRGDSRVFLAGAAVLSFLSSICVLLPPGLGVLLASRSFQGFGYGVFVTAIYVYATREIDPRLRGTLVGLIEAVGALSISLTPFLATWIQARLGYPASFLTAAGLAALVIAGASFLTKQRREIRLNEGSQKTENNPHRLLTWKAVLPGLVSGALFFAASAFISLSPLIAQRVGVASISAYMGLRAFCTVPTRLLSGVISDRRRPALAILPGFALLTLSMLLLPFVSAPGWVFLIPVLVGFGMGIASPAITNWMLGQVEPAEHAIAINTFTILVEGSGFFGAWLAGLFLQTGNMAYFMLFAPAAAAGAALYLILIAREKRL